MMRDRWLGSKTGMPILALSFTSPSGRGEGGCRKLRRHPVLRDGIHSAAWFAARGQDSSVQAAWIPAFAGMTELLGETFAWPKSLFVQVSISNI